MSYLAETISTLRGNTHEKTKPVYVLFQQDEEKGDDMIEKHLERCDICGHHKKDDTFYGGCRKLYEMEYGKPTSILFTTRPIDYAVFCWIEKMGCASWRALRDGEVK